MRTFRKAEQIAETILEHTAPEEIQNYLDMDRENRFLWIKHKIASLEAQA
ncbi:TPA: hypothetical protein U1V99_001682 [Streptococcus suis]|nr:hypothetical protein [Streptococcus suis]HEM4073531.1 hypothetical protein [Streptococcus suis]